MKFRAKQYVEYNAGFLGWYFFSMLTCGLVVGGLWHSQWEYRPYAIIASPVAWFFVFSLVFWGKYHTEKHARYLACHARHFAIMTPITARDHKYTYFIDGPGGRQIVMTECVNMKEIEIIRSEYKPLFPKLFYTQLIRDLRSHGTSYKIDIKNLNHITLSQTKEIVG